MKKTPNTKIFGYEKCVKLPSFGQSFDTIRGINKQRPHPRKDVTSDVLAENAALNSAY